MAKLSGAQLVIQTTWVIPPHIIMTVMEEMWAHHKAITTDMETHLLIIMTVMEEVWVHHKVPKITWEMSHHTCIIIQAGKSPHQQPMSIMLVT
jgi:hypothetical protein